MPPFQEVRVLMEDKKVGEFNRHIKEHVPYAKIVGVDVIGNMLMLPPPEEQALEGYQNKPVKQRGKLKKTVKGKSALYLTKNIQSRIRARSKTINAIKAGYVTMRDIAKASGRDHAPFVVVRQLKMLTDLGVIENNNGTYRLLRELDKYGC